MDQNTKDKIWRNGSENNGMPLIISRQGEGVMWLSNVAGLTVSPPCRLDICSSE